MLAKESASWSLSLPCITYGVGVRWHPATTMSTPTFVDEEKTVCCWPTDLVNKGHHQQWWKPVIFQETCFTVSAYGFMITYQVRCFHVQIRKQMRNMHFVLIISESYLWISLPNWHPTYLLNFLKPFSIVHILLAYLN